ncbi:hypothetical protein [Pimelobacter sp. 30-1]|uniref:hypothetical protein n=1 Tax=Pimelobacter sp. 30-1 TaxID=2004991 RepID=UPI001C03B1C6|nr:hypothetical protein [Pimelobacter sp. 30-1]MBU2698798.1 hypothetical protein [Pimelobacter sp. 30-1]
MTTGPTKQPRSPRRGGIKLSVAGALAVIASVVVPLVWHAVDDDVTIFWPGIIAGVLIAFAGGGIAVLADYRADAHPDT